MKTIITSVLVAAAASLTLGGCVTGNASITDEQKISSIQIGTSTMRDVERAFGKPGDVEFSRAANRSGRIKPSKRMLWRSSPSLI
ncbi:hypothetical protein [Caballeronia sp. GAOx1]|uniref:hypothetical protein n=1 Tax=Caballeronia sp. GAOx1 TaxID=2921761 RepID=UPI00202795A3|nr:hypothetical protein [Caballeronia sp. GAOx1]